MLTPVNDAAGEDWLSHLWGNRLREEPASGRVAGKWQSSSDSGLYLPVSTQVGKGHLNPSRKLYEITSDFPLSPWDSATHPLWLCISAEVSRCYWWRVFHYPPVFWGKKSAFIACHVSHLPSSVWGSKRKSWGTLALRPYQYWPGGWGAPHLIL